MKKTICMITLITSLLSCHSDKIPVLDKGYLGMTTREYGKVFDDGYVLHSSSSKVVGKLQPVFTQEHLTSLSVYINDISDFDTAYTVYELGNDFSEKYGTPLENKETVWAGGSSKYFKWKTGTMEVEYSYHYNQIPGTSGLLYTGEAKVVYNSDLNFKYQFNKNAAKKTISTR